MTSAKTHLRLTKTKLQHFQCKWCKIYLGLGEGQLLQTILVPPFSFHDGVLPLGEQPTERVNQLQIGGGCHIIVATEFREKSANQVVS